MKIKDIFWNRKIGIMTTFSFFLSIVGSVGGVLLVGDRYAAYVCATHQELTGQESRYIFLNGCYVNHRGDWLRYSAYENVIIARDVLK